MTARVILLDPVTSYRLDMFRKLLPEGMEFEGAPDASPETQMDAIRRATFAITGGVPVTPEMMRAGAASGLKAVHKWGVGYDNIAIDVARDMGVRVLRTTGANAQAVAETALGLILALQRNLIAGHVALQAGVWAKGQLSPSCTLIHRKTIGLIGLGAIGTALARMLRGFGAGRVLYAKPNALSPEQEAELGVTRATIEEVLTQSDVISLHCALTPETARLINAAAIARMKPGAFLINTARGGVIDEAAVIAGVASGQLAGVALDVYDEEPLPPTSPLIGKPGIILTPHLSALARENAESSILRMLRNFQDVGAGRAPAELDVVV